MDDPLVAEEKVPSYEIVREKILEIDSNVIISRTYYVFDNLTYRFQLIRKDKMCMVEIPKRLLDDIKNNGLESEQELAKILKFHVENSECWSDL
jgi:hypothetical protein